MSTVQLFEDNTVAYITVKSEKDAREFQKDLDKLVQWEKIWMMEFHPDQSKLSVSPEKTTSLGAVKYLGIHLSRDLRWNKHVSYITSKANSTLGFILQNIDIGNPQIKEHAYETLVHPILEYSQTLWDPYIIRAITKIESLHFYRATLC